MESLVDFLGFEDFGLGYPLKEFQVLLEGVLVVVPLVVLVEVLPVVLEEVLGVVLGAALGVVLWGVLEVLGVQYSQGFLLLLLDQLVRPGQLDRQHQLGRYNQELQLCLQVLLSLGRLDNRQGQQGQGDRLCLVCLAHRVVQLKIGKY